MRLEHHNTFISLIDTELSAHVFRARSYNEIYLHVTPYLEHATFCV